MRKYKAKRLDNGEWITGWCVMVDNMAFVFTGFNPHVGWCYNEVDPDTVCQSTGLKDSTTEIYENDRGMNDSGLTWVVKWDKEDARFHLVYDKENMGSCRMNQKWITETGFEIIGNLHDRKG